MDGIIGFFSGVLSIFGFGEVGPTTYTGYVEGDYVYISATSPGQIENFLVSTSDAVEAGDILFIQDPTQAEAAVAAALSQVKVAEATLDNLLTGARDEEVAVVQAQLDQAKANLSLTEQEYNRNSQLVAEGIASRTILEANLANLASAQAQTRQLQAQITSMTLPARPAQRAQAEASLAAAQAALESAQDKLDARTITAPVAGKIEQVFYDTGEVLQPSMPVLSLLPENARKIYFFVPEPDRASFQVGDQLTMECTGCPPDTAISITFIDAQPQFTPPIIYSRDERARLVYRAEGYPVQPLPLFPGQPVTLGLPE